MRLAPYANLYRTTARSPANVRILNELGLHYTSVALHPYKPREGGLTRKGKKETYIGSKL